jgi:plasmid stability protein
MRDLGHAVVPPSSVPDPAIIARGGPQLQVVTRRVLEKRPVSEWYLLCVAMTLRLTDDEREALRQQAQREGRSMQDVARAAVRDYIERSGRRELLGRVLDEELPRYAEALRRLGE